MTLQYDAAKEAELEAALQSKNDEIDDLRKAMGEEQAKDGEWSAARTNKFVADSAHEGNLCTQKKEIEDALAEMRNFKPNSALPEVEVTDDYMRVREWMNNIQGNGSIEIPLNMRTKRQMQEQIIAADRVVTTAAGSAGATIATDTEASVVSTLARYGDALRLPASIVTPKGNPKKFPFIDEASAEGEFLATENTELAEQDLSAFGDTTLDAHTVSSKRFKLSKPIIEDSELDMVSFSMNMLLRRIGRSIDKAIIKGVSGKFTGIEARAIVQALPGRTGYSFLSDFGNMEQLIDRGYMMGEGTGFGALGVDAGLPTTSGFTGWAISRKGENLLRTAVDNDGRPLWRMSTRDGSPNTIGGMPYIVSENIDDPAAGKVSILFGNFSYMLARYVGSVTLESFYDGSTATTQTVLLLGTTRFDMDLLLKPDSNSKSRAFCAGQHAS